MAIDLATGKVLWTQQVLPDDAWIPACAAGAAPAGNCPENIGPDYDFGASPILKTIAGGRRLLISVAKSGVAWAMDPDCGGAVVWKTPAPKTPAGPGRRDGVGRGRRRLASLRRPDERRRRRLPPGHGRAGLDDAAGASRAHPPRRPERRGHGHAGDGVLRGWDGVLRALEADSGRVVWEYDTQREFETVNRLPARGGSMGAPGPTVAGGMVFVGSGYIGVRSGTPGNVLLAFGVESR